MVDKIIERNKFSLTKANFIALWDDRLLKRSWVTTTKYNPSGRNGCLSLRSLVNYICSCSIKTRLLKILGFASMRITVVLFMQATREKVTPLVILKCKDSEIEKFMANLGVYQTKAWVNQYLWNDGFNWFFLQYLIPVGIYWFGIHAEPTLYKISRKLMG